MFKYNLLTNNIYEYIYKNIDGVCQIYWEVMLNVLISF